MPSCNPQAISGAWSYRGARSFLLRQRFVTCDPVEELYGFGIARDFPNGLCLLVGHQRGGFGSSQLGKFLQELRVIESLAESLLDNIGALLGRCGWEHKRGAGQPEVAIHCEHLPLRVAAGEALKRWERLKHRMFVPETPGDLEDG